MTEIPNSTSPLPEKWVTASIDDVAKVLPGYGFPEKYQGKVDGEIPFFKVRDISEAFLKGSIYLKKANNYVTLSECEELRAKPLEEGSIVFAKIGEALKLNRRAILTQPSLVDNNVVGISPIPEVFYSLYAYYFLLTVRLEGLSRATTVPSVRKSDIEEIKIPLAPFNEQRRIVAKVEELFSFLDAGTDSLRKVQAQLKRYRQAVLKYAFEGKLTEEWRKTHKDPTESAHSLLDQILKNRSAELKNSRPISVEVTNLNEIPENWVWTTIGELFKVGSGGTPSRRKPEYWKGTIPWVSSGEVDFREIRGTNECISQEGLRNSSAKLYPPGTILMALYGEGKTRGQVAILELDSTTNQAIACICCSKTRIPPKYVYWWLCYRYYETRKIREGANQPNMYLHHVQKIPIPLAPLHEQKEIVKEIEQLTSLANVLQETIRASLLQSERLRQSILKHAFGGKLVAQDSSDEPAEILLQRIKAQKIDEIKKNSIGLINYVK